MLKPELRIQLSKTLSHALRHAPETYGLTLDEKGSVSLADLVAAIRKSKKEFSELDELDVIELTFNAEKVRHIIQAGRIKALYGHSIGDGEKRIAEHPPTELYHGTSIEALKLIMQQGLRPMKRMFVHLSVDIETAHLVGRRKSPTPVILKIQAHAAANHGIEFFNAGDKVWLAREIGAEFISPV